MAEVFGGEMWIGFVRFRLWPRAAVGVRRVREGVVAGCSCESCIPGNGHAMRACVREGKDGLDWLKVRGLGPCGLKVYWADNPSECDGTPQKKAQDV